jgi:SHOCT-like protein
MFASFDHFAWKEFAAMSEERKMILDMLADGKITVDEAERLLQALRNVAGDGPGATSATPKSSGRPKYLRVLVNPKDGAEGAERVDVRVPLKLIRAGMKLKGMMPAQAGEKFSTSLEKHGIKMDFDNLKGGDVDTLVEALTDMAVDVDADGRTVRVFCE